jgi:hypothetical protein
MIVSRWISVILPIARMLLSTQSIATACAFSSGLLRDQDLKM